MVLSPNDEEVGSSKKPTQFKTKVHKPYPISDHYATTWEITTTNHAITYMKGQNWYAISDQNG